jgi:LysR family transcriptional regulator, hydrogen peroxide-inducible genes activator
MIDRYLLRYFLAVIDQGNFTRAAEACNVTQATLSIGIAKLEKILGPRLFRRTNRRVDLTQEGVRFASHAREIEEAFYRAERSVIAQAPTRMLRLGILNTIPINLATKFARSIQTNAGVQIELVEGRARDLSEKLAVGRIDFALTLEPRKRGSLFEPVHSEGYSLALAGSHPLAQSEVIDGASLADNIMIVRRHCELLAQTSQYFTQRGVRPFFAARTTRDDHALAYVAEGFGVTVMPDCFNAGGVVRMPLADFEYVRTIGIEGTRRDDDFWQCLDEAKNIFQKEYNKI